MLGPVSAILPNIGLSIPASAAPRSSTAVAGFGPDFLLGAVTSQRTGPAGGYDALGRPLAQPENSPVVKAREANLTVARFSLQSGNDSGARAAAQRVLQNDPNNLSANYIIARVNIREGQYEDAEKILLKLKAGSNDNQFDGDLRAVRALKQGESEVLVEVRKRLKQKSTAGSGIQLAGDFLKAAPENLSVRLELAAYYEKLGNLRSAGGELANAIRAVPGSSAGPLIVHLERFAARHPGDRGSYDLLAQGYAAAGRLDDAARAFDQVLRLAGDDYFFQSQVKRDFADVYSRKGQELQQAGREAEAVEVFRKALGIVNDDKRRADLSDLQFDRGRRFERQGLDQSALKAFNDARVHLPIADRDDRKDALVKAYDRLAASFQANGDLKNTVAARSGAYLLDTEDATRKRSLADAHNSYGLQLMDSHKYREAYRQFKAATKLFGDDAGYAANLSAAQSHL